MNIASSVKRAFSPRITERDLGRKKITTGMENVLTNTTGDVVDPFTTFVVFKNQAVEGKAKDGTPVLQVTDMERDGKDVLLRKGWIPKDAFQEVGDAYYLPTYKFNPTSSVIGGTTRGLVAAGLPGAVAGAASGLAAGKLGKSTLSKFAIGALAGAGATTALQAAV